MLVEFLLLNMFEVREDELLDPGLTLSTISYSCPFSWLSVTCLSQCMTMMMMTKKNTQQLIISFVKRDVHHTCKAVIWSLKKKVHLFWMLNLLLWGLGVTNEFDYCFVQILLLTKLCALEGIHWLKYFSTNRLNLGMHSNLTIMTMCSHFNRAVG